jgi:hypothetical protein
MAKRNKYPSLIHGVVFTPCFMTEEEFEEGYKKSSFYVERDFKKEYENHIAAMSHISNIAKSYIYNNWEKVNDWGDLEVVISHAPTGDTDYYYSHKEKIRKKDYHSSISGDIFLKIDKERKRKQKPVKSFGGVVLDPTDGDFSVTINGKEYWWISDESVIIIADYIEKQLEKQKS